MLQFADTFCLYLDVLVVVVIEHLLRLISLAHRTEYVMINPIL